MNSSSNRGSSGGAGPASAALGALQPVKLTALAPAGTNPGNLLAKYHVPAGNQAMPLVVILHGCGQSASSYDAGSGWSALAERHGFAVLFPKQQRSNNPNRCFNWFSPHDVRRGSGEVLSIREMVAAMIGRHAIDPARVFVTGLSAGGAMASALLATYPDVFAGGAIIAGLPAGAAGSMRQAFDRMRGYGHVDAASSAAYVRAASEYQGRWPTVAVWHGGADGTVSPSNAEAILAQWRALHGVAAAPDEQSESDGAVFRSWWDKEGRVCIEDCRIAAMGHGTPIATSGGTACGSAAAFMLDVGISSTWHSAARWGLLDPKAMTSRQPGREAQAEPPSLPTSPSLRLASSRSSASSASMKPAAPFDIQATIETALRTAGLMH